MKLKKSWVVPPNVRGFQVCKGDLYTNDGIEVRCTRHYFSWSYKQMLDWVDDFKNAGCNILEPESKLKLPDWW